MTGGEYIMGKKFKVVYYLNQFFGQIGGEDQAGMTPQFVEGNIGPATAFDALLKEEGEVVGTVICGDNYFNEKKEDAMAVIGQMIKDANPDIVVTGPAFNAGRYGMACGEVAKYVIDELKIPAVTGMYIENPAVELCKAKVIIAETGASAGGMRKALKSMSNIVKKIIAGEELELPKEDGYIPQGKRKTVFVDKNGSERAVDMLLNRLNGRAFTTELPMPVFDTVDPADAIKDITKATIALITTGGMVPKGNPDRIQSASAQIWGRYDINEFDSLKEAGFITIHGGFDPVYANEDPDRVAPLAMLKKLKAEGQIGKVDKYFYTTTGTGTAVGKSVQFGREMGELLKADGVDGVILTST
jgi:glycine reductase